MAKVKSNKVSGSGTFRVGKDAHAKGSETKEYGKGAGSLLPAGQYEGVVKESEVGEQGGEGVTKGSPKYTLRLRVDRENPANNGNGGDCFMRAIVHDNTIGQFYNMLDGMGVYDEYVTELPNGDVDITLPSESTVKGWVGTPVIVYVKHREYNGATQLDVRIDPIDGAKAGGTKPKKEKKKAAK